MLLRALLAQTRRAAGSSIVADIVRVNAEKNLRVLSRALSTGAKAEKASMPQHHDVESSSSQQSSDLEDFRAMLSDFAAREIAPLAEEIDKKNTAPMYLWTKMGEFGLHGITVPPEHGGLGLGYLEHVVAMEELSRASGAVALSYGAHSNLCISQLTRNATEEQKKKFLPKLLTGEHVGALAMSEPNAGSDVVSMRTKATKVDGGWLLDGTKMWITNGTVADVVVMYAKTDPAAGPKGVTAFVVDKANTQKGFSAHQKLDKLGMRGSDTCELVFDKCFVPDENVLGEVGKGVYVLFSGLDYERLVLSGGPLGLARAALDVAVPYAAQRKQFGSRIGDFQLVAAKLADGWMRTQAARALVYSAATKADAKKQRISSSAPSPSPPPVSGGWSSKGERARECAAAILFSAETATQVALDALQVLGGNGYINEYPTGRILRDAKLYEIGAGTSEIRRLVIGRELMREAAEEGS